MALIKNEKNIYSLITFLLFIIALIISIFIKNEKYSSLEITLVLGLLICIALFFIMTFIEKVFNKTFINFKKIFLNTLFSLLEQMLVFFFSSLFTIGLILSLNLNSDLFRIVGLLDYILTNCFSLLFYKKLENKKLLSITMIIALMLLFSGLVLYPINPLLLLLAVLASLIFSVFIYWLFKVQIPRESK
jgi:hypothetical protein